LFLPDFCFLATALGPFAFSKPYLSPSLVPLRDEVVGLKFLTAIII